MKQITADMMPHLIAQFPQKQMSSFIALTSIYGYSQSEWVAIADSAPNIYISDHPGQSQLLALYDVNPHHRTARIQLCASTNSCPPNLFIQQLLETYGLDQLSSYVFVHDTNEIRLLTALGFAQQATFRDHVFINGHFQDVLVYSYQGGAE